MKISSKRTLVVGAVLGGLLAMGTVAAHATDLQVSGSGTKIVKASGVASGNDVAVHVGPVSPNIPVNVCGVAVNALATSGAQASCRNTQIARSTGRSHGRGRHGGSHGTGSGGGANGGAPTVVKSASGLLSGNDIVVGVGPVSPNIPVNVCGIAASVLGRGASATCNNLQLTKSKGVAVK